MSWQRGGGLRSGDFVRGVAGPLWGSVLLGPCEECVAGPVWGVPLAGVLLGPCGEYHWLECCWALVGSSTGWGVAWPLWGVSLAGMFLDL